MRPAAMSLVRSARAQLQLSARAFHRIHKLARTIADLAGSDRVQPEQVVETIHLTPGPFPNAPIGRRRHPHDHPIYADQP
jgi:predicted ATPase with chaperone activity